jgi:histidinol-phosphatase (PHP family)
MLILSIFLFQDAMYDYHIHPDFSFDAEGTIEEFCECALAKGLREICFTTHLDSDPKRNDCFVRVDGKKISVFENAWLIEYEKRIIEAKEKYETKGLIVLLGVEVDYFKGVEDYLPSKFFETDFDMIIGSVHLIDHKAITIKSEAEEIYSKYGLDGFVGKYYELLLNCIKSGLFDIIGHMDIYRRYGMAAYGKTMRNRWENHIDSIADAMKQNNIGFEINTSWLRRGHDEPMPESSLVDALVSRGIRIVTIGSDSHELAEVGSFYSDALQILQKAGIDSPCTFRKREARC